MRLKSSALLLMSVCALPMLSLQLKADVTVTPVITAKDVQADFTAGKYPECIQKITKILAAVPAPSPLEKAELLNTKADCLMQEKDANTAADAYTAAAAAYGFDKKAADKKSDTAAAALDTATAELIKKSASFLYTPKTYTDKNGAVKLLSQKPASDKTPAPEPIDIVNAATRTQAFTALFNDEYTTDQTPFKALQGKNVLQPILDFAPQLADLDAIETVASGADTKTAPMESAFYTDAKTTIDAQLTNMQTQLTTISANAETTVNQPATPAPARSKKGGGGAPAQQAAPKKRGLSDSDRSTLTDFITQIEKMPDNLKTITPAIPASSDQLKPEQTNATTLRRKIEAVLNKTY